MKKSITLLVGLMLISVTAWAEDDHGGHRHDHDHDQIRREVEEGRLVPLKDILARVEQSYPGQLLGVELEEEHGAMVYEIKLLAQDGRVLKLLYDARSGDLLKTRQREHEGR